MIETSYLILFHVLSCGIIYLLISKRILGISMQLFPMVVFIPLWGLLAVGIAEYQLRNGKVESKDIQLKRFEADKDRYTLLKIREDSMEQLIVPLEEAILVNTPEVRREMILEIIQQKPKDYIAILQKARLSEDTEVSHYASASIMEIQRNYELDIQKSERHLRKNKSTAAIKNHIAILTEYIDSGLLAKNIQNVQRRRLVHYLVELSSQTNDSRAYSELIHHFIHLQKFDDAALYLEEALQIWKEDADFYLLKLKLFFAMKDQVKFQEEINKLKQLNLYLTPEIKEFMSFWIHDSVAVFDNEQVGE